MVLTSVTDASLWWLSTPPSWHIDAVGGASTPSRKQPCARRSRFISPPWLRVSPNRSAQRGLQPLVGERLEGLEVGGHRMQPRTERRAARCLRHRRDDPRAAARAAHRQPPMLRHDLRRHLRQLDPLADADDLGRKIGRAGAAAARARARDGARRPHRDRRSAPGCGPRGPAWRRQAWPARAAPCDPSTGGLEEVREVFSGRCSRSTSSISSSCSAAQDRCDPSHEGISEIRPAQEPTRARADPRKSRPAQEPTRARADPRKRQAWLGRSAAAGVQPTTNPPRG